MGKRIYLADEGSELCDVKSPFQVDRVAVYSLICVIGWLLGWGKNQGLIGFGCLLGDGVRHLLQRASFRCQLEIGELELLPSHMCWACGNLPWWPVGNSVR